MDDDCDIDALLSLINDDEENGEMPQGQSDFSGPSVPEMEEPTMEEAAIEAKLRLMQAEMAKLQNALQKKKQTADVDIFHASKVDSHAKPQSSLLPRSGRTAVLVTDVTPSVVVKRDLSKQEKENLLQSMKKPHSDVHTGDTDSSEDEERRTHESKYNTYAKSVMKIQKKVENVDRIKGVGVNKGWTATGSSVVKLGLDRNPKPAVNMFTCEYSGIKILNPSVSRATLADRMQGKKMVKMSTLPSFLKAGDLSSDWVTMGVVVNKSEPKTSQKGNAYAIWKLCDLRDCNNLVTMFLFGAAQKDLWKTIPGTVIGLLSPSVMADREGGAEKSNISIDSANRVMILGTSKDFGTCKAKGRKDGRPCTNLVNLSDCEYCVYHVQAEYKKTASKRSDLQSTYSGPNGLKAGQGKAFPGANSLRNKVLGKSEVFYAGQSFSAVKETKTKSELQQKLTGLESLRKPDGLKQKDDKLLAALIPDYEESKLAACKVNNLAQSKMLSELMSAPTPGARNLLKCLSKKEEVIPEKPKANVSAKDFIAKQLRERAMKPQLTKIPQLGHDLDDGSFLEFDVPSSKATLPTDVAKLRAMELLKKKGPVQKVNPNAISKVSADKRQELVKRKLETDSSPNTCPKEFQAQSSHPEQLRKKSKLESLRSVEHEKLLTATSAHADLLEQAEDEAQEAYFSKLEKKEQLEKKMEETFEVKTKAVYCRKCKYTAFAASDMCRNERHELKVIHEATKRFFSCKNCKNRTIALDKYPHHSCKNCGSSSWERTSMHKAKDLKILDSEILSVRGDEIKNLNSIGGKVNINL